MKTFLSIMQAFLLTFVSVLLGDASGVMMAATDLPDAGKTEGGAGAPASTNGEGVSTTTEAIDEGDADYLAKEIDRKITKIRPMSTPIDQISRQAESTATAQMDFKYFSIGTRPIKTTLHTAITKQTTGNSVELIPENADIFTMDDTIRVVGVKAVTNFNNAAYDATSPKTPDLVLKVCGFSSNGNPLVYAVNGCAPTEGGQPIHLPAISANTVLIRMGKACGELDVQTGRFSNIPQSETQYCQNFMMQVEESHFDAISAKNVDWNFSDMEEDSVYDMRLGMEGSFLFGDKGKIKHASKDNMYTWFTGGIWWQAAKDIVVGKYANSKVTIDDDDLVDIAKDLFVGTGSGSKRKLMFCGSTMLATLSKIKSEKFRLKDTVEVWNLKFKSWDTDFGEILTMHHEFFDMNGMSDCAFALDPEYLAKKKFINWTRSVLDLKSAGVRNTEAIVLQEASALYLRYPKAHARMKLAAA